jgi:hypothetical protein
VSEENHQHQAHNTDVEEIQHIGCSGTGITNCKALDALGGKAQKNFRIYIKSFKN